MITNEIITETLTKNDLILIRKLHKFEKIPNFEFILKELNLSDNYIPTLRATLNRLESLGYVRQKHRHRWFTAKIQELNLNGDTKLKIAEQNVKRRVTSFLSGGNIVIRTALGLSGILCFVLSFIYTKNFQSQFIGSNEAKMFSLAIVLLSFSFFELCIYYLFIIKKTKIGVLFLFLCFLAIVPSIGSTIFGQYIGYMKSIEISKEDTIYNDIIIRENIILRTIGGYEEELTKLSTEGTWLSSEENRLDNWKVNATNTERLDKVRLLMLKAQEEYVALVKEKTSFIEKEDIDVNAIKDFYVFFGEALDIPPNVVQLIFSFFLSFIIDILGPAGLAVALWQKKESY